MKATPRQYEDLGSTTVRPKSVNGVEKVSEDCEEQEESEEEGVFEEVEFVEALGEECEKF